MEQCRGIKKCSHCAQKAHEEGLPCPLKDSPARCINCEGPHKPTDRSCPAYLRQRKIRELAAANNIPLVEAREIVEGREGKVRGSLTTSPDHDYRSFPYPQSNTASPSFYASSSSSPEFSFAFPSSRASYANVLSSSPPNSFNKESATSQIGSRPSSYSQKDLPNFTPLSRNPPPKPHANTSKPTQPPPEFFVYPNGRLPNVPPSGPFTIPHPPISNIPSPPQLSSSSSSPSSPSPEFSLTNLVSVLRSLYFHFAPLLTLLGVTIDFDKLYSLISPLVSPTSPSSSIPNSSPLPN